MSLNYNYIYFNSNYKESYGIVDKNEYNSICLRDAEQMEDVHIVQSPMDYLPSWMLSFFLRKIYGKRKKGKILNKLLYPFYFKKKSSNKKPYCFVVANSSLPIDYLRYLRRQYTNCKIVKVHRDLIKITLNTNSDYTEKSMNEIFDLRLTYDPGEAKKHGLSYFHEIESMIDIKPSKNYPICDVFFCGAAKDRLPKILKAYDVFTKAGLKCFFYIAFAPKDSQVYRDGIVYADKHMPYIDMLQHSIDARAMLDINQEGAVGMTSRFLEAVMYNKLMFTDIQSVKDSPYYNPRFIQVVNDLDELAPSFIENSEYVDFHYKGDFSPCRLIEQIDRELTT